jgi:hypothetical protein
MAAVDELVRIACQLEVVEEGEDVGECLNQAAGNELGYEDLLCWSCL